MNIGDSAAPIMGCCCCSFIVAIIAFLLCYAVVEPLQVGMTGNHYFKRVDYDQVYEPGRYFLGINNFFFHYPTTVQTIDFSDDGGDGASLRCWSRDGQLVFVDISFFYEINKESIFDIFRAYEDQWKLPLVQIARAAIKTETTKFNTTDFFTKRLTLKDSLFTSINDAFQNEGFEVIDVQLRKIDIPYSFENVVESKIVSAQNATTELYRRNQTIVEATTVVIQETAQQEVNKWIARANGDSAILLANATANGFKLIQQANAESYAGFATAFDFTANELLEYVYNTMIADRKNRLKLVVGFPKPTLSVAEDTSAYTSAVQTIKTDKTVSVAGASGPDDIGGTFTLTVGGVSTGAIGFDASAADVKAALESLSSVGLVAVERTANGDGFAWSVTFLTNTGSIPDMLVDSSLLTGTNTIITVATDVDGVGPSNAVYTWQ